jgi:hypothetical protein
VPPPHYSPIATFLSSVPARSHPSLLRLIVLFLFYVFFGFPVFCFLCIIFVLIFLCILFLLGFPVLVFPCIASLCLFCAFFGFYSFADLLRACFTALCPLLGLFPCPHRIELPTCPLVYGVCMHAIGFISLYFYCFLLVISSVSIGLLLGVMLGLDFWVVDMNIILAFG